jgi:hypothetical protein
MRTEICYDARSHERKVHHQVFSVRFTNVLSPKLRIHSQQVCDKVKRLPGLSAVSQAATMPCRLQLCAVL